MANERVASTEETLQLIRDKAAKESDEFIIKVSRSTHAALPADRIASFSGAVVNHLVSPELWVPQLAGGGKYKLQAYHVTDINKPIGGVVAFAVEGDVLDVDVSAPTKSTWRGPAVLDFPQKNNASQRQPNDMGYAISPPGPGSGNSASGNTPSWPRSPGGGVHREPYDDPNWERTPRGLAAVELERRKLEEEKLAAERERAREKLDAQQKAHEAEMRAFRSEMLAEMKANKAPTGPDPMVEMLKQQAEDRRELAKQAAEDRRAAELARSEDRRQAAAQQDKADSRFLALLEKMNDRPKEDPLTMVTKVAEILNKGNSNEAQMKMMSNMAEMHGVQMETAMRFVETAADIQLGGQENSPGWVKGIEAAVKSVGSVLKGVQVKRPLPPAPPAPPQIQQGQPQQAPPQQQPQRVPPVIDQFIHAIENYNLPVAQIATALRENIMDPTLQAAFQEAGGDFEKLIQSRLGNWANTKPENAKYLTELIAEVKRQFVEAGLIEADAPIQAASVAQAEAEGQEEEAEYEEGDEADDE